MAERVEQSSQDTSAAENAAEDLSVLFSDQSILLGEKTVTVQEYPFMTWIELKPQCSEINSQLAAFMTREADVSIDELLECFEDNFQIMQKLLAVSISESNEYLKTLSDDEMQSLMLTWWGVNKHFFLRSANRILRKTNQQSDGQTSSSA